MCGCVGVSLMKDQELERRGSPWRVRRSGRGREWQGQRSGETRKGLKRDVGRQVNTYKEKLVWLLSRLRRHERCY